MPPHTPLRTPLAPPHTMLIVCVCVDTLSFYKQRNPATSRVLLFAQMRAGAIAGPSVFFWVWAPDGVGGLSPPESWRPIVS